MIRQSLFMIQFPATAPYTQVESFPQGTSRSRSGSLHVRPSSTAKVSQSELAHLQTLAPWGPRIKVLRKVAPKPLPNASDASQEAKAAAASERSIAAERVPKAGGGKKPKKITDGI